MAVPQSFFEKNKQPKVEKVSRSFCNPEIFRKGTATDTTRVNFAITSGGIGDYLCWMSVFDWIDRTHPHVRGHLYVPHYLLEIYRHFFGKRGRWVVHDRSEMNEEVSEKHVTYVPPRVGFINACGASLFQTGFIYFANRATVPDGHDQYLEFLFKESDLSGVVDKFGLPDSGFIVTPGITDSNRGFTPEIFNKLCRILKDKGFTPIFLGKREFAVDRKSTVSEEYDLSLGVDLMDQTTLMEAAKIIEYAKGVAGVDNGLLHLAALTTTPIIYGHTVMEPEYRSPKRKVGKVVDIVPDIGCRFCMTRVRYMFKKKMVKNSEGEVSEQWLGHDFKNCMYHDVACLDALAGDSDLSPWAKAIDEVTK